MKKRKPFYNVGDILQILTSGCQTEANYEDKLALVLNVLEGHLDEKHRNHRQPHYELQVFNYTGTSEWVNPQWPCPYEEIGGDPKRVIARQSDLRKLKERKCKKCKVKLDVDWWMTRCPPCNKENCKQVVIDNEARYAKQRKQPKEEV
tara:strand:- start:43 stop:486 length:444 start_codon:yes stop_codon:yes gene_type:complete